MNLTDGLALDDYNLTLTALITLVYQLLFFVIALIFDCNKLTGTQYERKWYPH